LDKICTENCIKIIQIHQNMHSKLFLENNKKKISCSSFIFQPSAAQDALNWLGPASARSPRPHPGRNLGLGRQTAPRARARLGLDLAQRISGVRSDPTDERPFRVDQNPGRGRRPGTLAISALALSLSPFSVAAARTAATEQPRARKAERAVLCAVAGPLAGARAPQRVSTPPSSGPGRGASLAEPGEPAPPARLLLPRRRKKPVRLFFFFRAGGGSSDEP